MRRIASRQNALVARYRAAARRDDAELLLLDGPHLVADALAAGLTLRQALVTTEALGRGGLKNLIDRIQQGGADVAVATASVMAAVSPVRSSSLIVALADQPARPNERLYAGPSPLVVVACDVQDPGNVGAIARVAEAGGASGMVAAGACADPFGWKALRGSMGSALRLPIKADGDIGAVVAEARARRCRIVATTPRGGRRMFDADLGGPMALLVGGEGAGLPQWLVDAADERITVPMQAPVESLNAAVTAALVVYEAYRQRTRTAGPIS